MDQYSEFAGNGVYEIKAKGHPDEQWSSWFEGLTIAIFREREYPNRFGFVFVVFAVLLVLYVLLLAASPVYDLPEGIMVQALGQKILVYASVTSIFIQASGARQIAGEIEEPPAKYASKAKVNQLTNFVEEIRRVIR